MFQRFCFTFHSLQVQCPQSHGRNLCRAECKNLFSGIYGANFALIEPDKAVGNIQKVIQTVFGNHQCFSFRFQLQQNIFQLLNGSGVQVGRRLIQNKNIRMNRINAGACDPLFLTAGKLKNTPVQQAVQEKMIRRIRNSFQHIFLRQSLIFTSERQLRCCIHIKELAAGILKYRTNML